MSTLNVVDQIHTGINPQNPYQVGSQNEVDQDLLDRIYNSYRLAGAPSYRSIKNVVQVVPNHEPIQPRIDAARNAGGGIVQLASGTRSIGPAPLQIHSGVVVRGSFDAQGNLDTRLTTENSMLQMIKMGSGAFQSSGATVSGEYNSKFLTIDSGTLSPGYHVIGSPSSVGSGGAVIKILTVVGSLATLEAPLFQTFNNWPVLSGSSQIMGERCGVESLILDPRHDVDHGVYQKAVANSWVIGCRIEGRFGLRKTAIYSYHCYRLSWLFNHIEDAKQHGYGMGHGLDPDGNSTLVMISGNSVTRMRHSWILRGGAAGCVVFQNSSDEPIHPDFVNGGPSDSTFNGCTSACALVANDSHRIVHVNEGAAGPNNVIAFNTVRNGFVELRDQNRALDNLIILGNEVQGDIDTLSELLMPSIDTSSSNGPVDNSGNPQPGTPSNPRYWWY